MGRELKEKILAYLRDHNTMTLGTSLQDQPWAAAVFYASEGFTLYFFSVPASRHCMNLAHNPRVAVTIQEDYREWRAIKGIQMEGRVEEVGLPAEREKVLALYTRKYPGIMQEFTDPSSGPLYKALLSVRFYRVAPERVFFIDNEVGFGRRQEYPGPFA